ncbi:hypothetical protein U1Q18_002891 [Sarracenia purpurea var. burkii]
MRTIPSSRNSPSRKFNLFATLGPVEPSALWFDLHATFFSNAIQGTPPLASRAIVPHLQPSHQREPLTCAPHCLILTSIRPPPVSDHHQRYLQTAREAPSQVNGVVCFRVIEKKLRKKMTLGMRFPLIIE